MVGSWVFFEVTAIKFDKRLHLGHAQKKEVMDDTKVFVLKNPKTRIILIAVVRFCTAQDNTLKKIPITS